MAYLKENEKLITLSQDLHEKQQIESGINRYLIVVNEIPALVEAVEQEMGRNDRVHIIVSKAMAKIFEQHIEEVVRALDALTDLGKVQVIEIGIGKAFKSALTFADATSFIEFCRNEERVEYITFLEQQNEHEESRVLRDLMVERDSANERVEQFKQELYRTKQELEQALADYQGLETKVNHVYKIELENARTQLERQQDEISERERLYRLEKAKVKDYEAESSKYRTENKSLELSKQSLEELISDRKNFIRGLQSQIRMLEKDIERSEQEKREILKSRVDAEVHVKLSQQLEDVREQLRKLNTEFHALEMQSRKKDFIISEQKIEIEELRAGTDNGHSDGRSNLLDSVSFKSTNVYYVKVITPLPYLTGALKGLYEAIKRRDGGRTHICVLAHDDGLNDKIFKNFELYGTLGDVQAKHEQFMLYPTRRMFTGAEKFDSQVKSLLVVDFIRSNDYYISTEAFNRTITVCRDSSMFHLLGLQGTVVSLDANSLLDIKYDKRIDEATTKEMQQRYIQLKIDDWVKRLDILN